MTIIIDSSYLYALYNSNDSKHEEAMNFAPEYDGEFIVPQVVLPEVSYLFNRDLGSNGLLRFLTNFNGMNPPLEPLLPEDLLRMYEIAEMYPDSKFDFVDCCIFSLAERLDIKCVATFDHRDFTIFRPRHCDRFKLLP